MSSLVENFIRRIEKIVPSVATVPLPGTDHVNDSWLDTDIYPGELCVHFLYGKLYTTDGLNVIELNRENLILYGLELRKDTSGVLKLTVTSGNAVINGVTHYYESSGTDVLVSPNTGADPQLILVYAKASFAVGSSGPLLDIIYTSMTGSSDEPGGVFSKIADYENAPSAPTDALFLGPVLLYPGALGYDLFPLTISTYGDYYPKFSLTPSEFLRDTVKEVSAYNYTTLYFPGQYVIDNTSNTTYLSKRTFVSDSMSIVTDVNAGNIVSLSGTGGTGGSYSAISLAGGEDVYKQTVGTQFQFRSLTSSGPITIESDANNLTFGLSFSGIVIGATNVGTGTGVYKGTTGSTILEFRSLSAGSSNVSISIDGDDIVIDVNGMGTSAEGVNLGAGASADVYAGMLGDDLSFRRLTFGAGMSASERTNDIFIDAPGRNNMGVNVGTGTGLIYAGMSGDNLMYRSLSAGTNVTITTVSDIIVISSLGGGGTSSLGINIGSTGTTAGQIYAGMSSSDLTFRSIVGGYGISVAKIGEDIQIDSTLLDGVTGPTGPQGTTGPTGTDGTQGPTGPSGSPGLEGPQGSTGPQGSAGPQGSTGPQGSAGPQGSTGPQGTGAQGFQGVTGSQGPQGPQGQSYTGNYEIGVYKAKLLFTGGLIDSIDSAEDPSGNSILGEAGWTFTVSPSGTAIDILHPTGKVGVHFMTHAESTTNTFISRSIMGAGTGNTVKQNTSLNRLEIVGLSSNFTGVNSSAGSWKLYITWQFTENMTL